MKRDELEKNKDNDLKNYEEDINQYLTLYKWRNGFISKTIVGWVPKKSNFLLCTLNMVWHSFELENRLKVELTQEKSKNIEFHGDKSI